MGLTWAFRCSGQPRRGLVAPAPDRRGTTLEDRIRHKRAPFRRRSVADGSAHSDERPAPVRVVSRSLEAAWSTYLAEYSPRGITQWRPRRGCFTVVAMLRTQRALPSAAGTSRWTRWTLPRRRRTPVVAALSLTLMGLGVMVAMPASAATLTVT